jgi:hypothetical protein
MFHVVWHPGGTQATYNVIRGVIGTRGGHMFLILTGGLARCLAEWCLLYPITVIARGQSLGKTQHASSPS